MQDTCMSPSKALSLTAFVIFCPPKGEKKPCGFPNHSNLPMAAYCLVSPTAQTFDPI